VKRVLALDLSSHTGWATDAPGGGDKPLSGVVDFDLNGDEYGPTFSAFRQWLTDAAGVHNPEVLAFEAPLMPHGGNFMTSEQTVRLLIGLAAHAEQIGHALGLETVECNVQTVKRHFAGTGRADKAAMLARCQQLGWNIRNHNAADAAAVWDYTRHSLRLPNLTAGPLYGRRA
jgi:crossover junction endodeoxyribonuclease RuvC